jgi:hypothetical protein
VNSLHLPVQRCLQVILISGTRKTWNGFGRKVNWITFNIQFIRHYMKILNILLVSALITTEAIFVDASAQRIPSRPAPTGKIPSSGTGQSARPYSEYQPKPTGQIQGATQAADPGQVTVPAPVVQEGQVPKVNTSQDQSTFPERYQPAAAQPVEQVIEVEQTTTGTPQQTQQTGTNVQVETNVQTQRSTTTTQTAPAGTQPATSTTTTNRTTTAPGTQTTTTPRTAPQSAPVQRVP